MSSYHPPLFSESRVAYPHLSETLALPNPLAAMHWASPSLSSFTSGGHPSPISNVYTSWPIARHHWPVPQEPVFPKPDCISYNSHGHDYRRSHQLSILPSTNPPSSSHAPDVSFEREEPSQTAASWTCDTLYHIDSDPEPTCQEPAPLVKEETVDEFVFEIPNAAMSIPQTMGPMNEVPLRATQASKRMRKMMSVFRLNPFAIHNGQSGARHSCSSENLTWCGEEIGPLREDPVFIEFQLELEEAFGSDSSSGVKGLVAGTIDPPSSKFECAQDDAQVGGRWLDEQVDYPSPASSESSTLETPASIQPMSWIALDSGTYECSGTASSYDSDSPYMPPHKVQRTSVAQDVYGGNFGGSQRRRHPLSSPSQPRTPFDEVLPYTEYVDSGFWSRKSGSLSHFYTSHELS